MLCFIDQSLHISKRYQLKSLDAQAWTRWKGWTRCKDPALVCRPDAKIELVAKLGPAAKLGPNFSNHEQGLSRQINREV